MAFPNGGGSGFGFPGGGGFFPSAGGGGGGAFPNFPGTSSRFFPIGGGGGSLVNGGNLGFFINAIPPRVTPASITTAFPTPTTTPATRFSVQPTPPTPHSSRPTPTVRGGTSVSNGGGTNADNGVGGTVMPGLFPTGGSTMQNSLGNTSVDGSSGSSNTAPPLSVITTTQDGQPVTISLSVSNGGTVVVTVYPSASSTPLGSMADGKRNWVPVGLIVGILFAAIFVTLGVILAIFWVKRRKRRKDAVRAFAFTGAMEKHQTEPPPPFEEHTSRPPAASIAGSDTDAPLLVHENSMRTMRNLNTRPSMRSYSFRSRESQSDQYQDITPGHRPPGYTSTHMGSELSEESTCLSPVRNISVSSAPRSFESGEMYTPAADVWTTTRQMERIDSRPLQPNR